MPALLLQPIMAGAAFRIFVTLPPMLGALSYRLLRRADQAFAGEADPGAHLVYEGDAHVLMDRDGLADGTTYYYRLYAWDGIAWTDVEMVDGEPAATYADQGVDVLLLLRDRIEAGMRAEVAAGRITPASGVVRVLTAPPQAKDTSLPLVTVQLAADAPSQRALGEDLEGENGWGEFEGWYGNVRLDVTGWSFNPDERNELRRALKRIVLANLPVFDHEGLATVEFSQQDAEDFTTYAAPMYQTLGSFTCLAPSQVVGGTYMNIVQVPVIIAANP